MPNTDILLINPPFAMPDKPCLGIPVLAGYLKMRGFTVRALDLNIQFYREFLSVENIRRGAAYVKKRHAQLAGKEVLSPLETAEYANLEILANTAGKPVEQLYPFLGKDDLPNRQILELFREALHLASAPYFPDQLNFTRNTGYVRYQSPFSYFSSRDIIETLSRDTLFSTPLNQLLTASFREISPLMAGISVSFPDMIMPAFKCAAIIKSIAPSVHVTMGGAFVSVHMREIENTGFFSVVDSFILDEGEIPLERLIKELASQRSNLDNVPGIIYLDNKKKQIRRQAPSVPLKMEQLPAPDFTVFSIKNYLVKKDSMSLMFRLSRGCYWAKCAFCKTRLPIINRHDQPSAGHIYIQLKKLVEETGVRRFHFSDEAACPVVLQSLAERLIESGMNLEWGTNFRIDKRLTLERLFTYKRAGCHAVSLGLESYTARVLKLMNKGVDRSLVRRILTNFSWAGIDVSLYMIVGFPTETEEEAFASFQAVSAFKREGLIRDCVYNVFELTPFSVVSESPGDFGITGLPGQETRDLAPPVSRFESTGMKRERAFELCRIFIEQLNGGLN